MRRRDKYRELTKAVLSRRENGYGSEDANGLGRMAFKLWLLDEETIYEHVFERYTQLEGQSGKLAQDLGIQDRRGGVLEITFEPSGLEGGRKKKASEKKK